MKKSVKKLWVKALKSGVYKQGTGCPYRAGENTYCCLGLLLDVTGNGYFEFFERDFGEMKQGVYDAHWKRPSLTLPIEFMEEVGMDSEAVGDLMNKNDFDGWSFKKIANWIERHL
jgi:hypothetical protein